MNAHTLLQRLDLADKRPNAVYRRRMVWTQRLRHATQFAFSGFIVLTSWVHHMSQVDGATASIDALCPFGGIETLFQWVQTGGQYISKTHASNLILLAGVLLSTLLVGGAFCGWVCPFGALQDLLSWIRTRLRLPEIAVPERLDRVLRYGRYVALALILYQTIASTKLWFAGFDPYRTAYSLDWLFEFDLLTSWPAYVITLGVLAATMFVERGFCRYACPLGGTISVLGKLSLTRIRREADGCKGCALCARPCPVKLDVNTASIVSSNCIGCMACVDACPRHDTLDLRLKPAWVDGLQAIARRFALRMLADSRQ